MNNVVVNEDYILKLKDNKEFKIENKEILIKPIQNDDIELIRQWRNEKVNNK